MKTRPSLLIGVAAALSLVFTAPRETRAETAGPIQLQVQNGNVYVSTPFTNQFMLERLGPDMEWERIGLFTDLASTPMEWFRAVRIDGTPSVLNDSIVFTPGDFYGEDPAALPDAPGLWTLVRQGLGGENSIHGPLLRQTSAVGDDPPILNAPGPTAVLFWQSTAGETAIWRLGTNGTRTSSVSVNTNVAAIPVEANGQWVFGGLADISGDGRPELFWATTGSVMKTWFLDANYQFASQATLYGAVCPTDYQYRAIGKASQGNSSNPDREDLFFQDIYFGYIDTWHVKTDGTLEVAQPTEASAIDRAWQLRCCGDVNGDGRVELFFHHVTNRTTMTWFLDTNGVKTAITNMYPAIAAGWNMRCAGDANGDGLSEIFWQHNTGGTAVWFLNTNGVATVSRRIYSKNLATGWRMVAAIDVDGDARSELVWQHSNGSTAIWFLNTNGTLKTSRKISPSAVASKWKLRSAYSSPYSAPPPPPWVEVPGLPVGAYQGGADVLGSYIYHVGGMINANDATNVYRFDGNTWTAVAGLPGVRSAQAVRSYGGNLYAMGGWLSNNRQTNVFAFNGTTWSQVAGLPQAITYPASAVLGANLYVIGGSKLAANYTTNVFRFDGTSWTEVAGLPRGRYSAAAASLGGALFVAGGRDSTGSASTNVYRFDGSSWSEVAGLPGKREFLTLECLDSALYAVGGNDESMVVHTNVFKFDGSSWTEVEGLPQSLRLHTAAVLNGSMFVMGGISGGARTNVYRYSPP